MRLLIVIFITSCTVVAPMLPQFPVTRITLNILPLNQVNALCEAGHVDGCAMLKGNYCVIYAINDECVIDHELRHCRGWIHPTDWTDCK